MISKDGIYGLAVAKEGHNSYEQISISRAKAARRGSRGPLRLPLLQESAHGRRNMRMSVLASDDAEEGMVGGAASVIRGERGSAHVEGFFSTLCRAPEFPRSAASGGANSRIGGFVVAGGSPQHRIASHTTWQGGGSPQDV